MLKRLLLPFLVLLPVLWPLMALGQDGPANQPPQAKPAEEVLLKGCIRLLGSEAPLKSFSIALLIKTDTRNSRKNAKTDDEGNYSISVPKGAEVHAFAYGDYAIPPNFSILTKDAVAESKPVDIFVRPLTYMRVQGRVVGPDGKVRPSALIDFAPLDMMGDGSFMSFESPFRTGCENDGSFSVRLPAGYYDAWAYWGDRETENWDGYFVMLHQVKVFEDKEGMDFELERCKEVFGRVVDGRTGKPVECALDVLSGPWLTQRSIYTKPIKEDGDASQKGVFREELMRMNPDNFTLRFRSIDDNSAISIYPKLSFADLKDHADFVLYDPKLSRVDLRVVTQEHQLPMTPGHISIVPTGVVEAEAWMKPYLQVSGYLDNNANISFYGLPRGDYTIYGDGGQSILGFLRVDGTHQTHTIELDFPFLFGRIQYPDGSNAKLGRYIMRVKNAEGGEYPDREDNLFRNTALAAESQFFLGLGARSLIYTITFAAPDPSAVEVPWDLQAEDLKYISDPIEFRPLEKGNEEQTIKLKLNPNPKKSESEG